MHTPDAGVDRCKHEILAYENDLVYMDSYPNMIISSVFLITDQNLIKSIFIQSYLQLFLGVKAGVNT